MLVPVLLACRKTSNALTNQMVSATFTQLINCINAEQDSSFLASVYKCFTDSMRVLGGPTMLPTEFADGIIEAMKHQLHSMADRRKARAQQATGAVTLEDSREELSLMEEIEDFTLEDMAKMLQCFDVNHTLIVVVSSVRDLGFNSWDSEDEGDEDG